MLSTSVSGTVFELRLPLIVTADTLRSVGVPAHRLSKTHDRMWFKPLDLKPRGHRGPCLLGWFHFLSTEWADLYVECSVLDDVHHYTIESGHCKIMAPAFAPLSWLHQKSMYDSCASNISSTICRISDRDRRLEVSGSSCTAR